MSEWVKYFRKVEASRTIYNQCHGKRRLIELIIQNCPRGGQILEAGCGTAQLSIILADYGFKVTALDLTGEVLEYARSRLYLKKLKIEFLQGNILELSSLFKAKTFDVVTHSGVLEHFRDPEIIKSLSEQKNISKKVIFNIPNNRVELSLANHFGDERFLSNKTWVKLIRSAGFNNCQVFGGYDLPRITFLLPGLFLHRKFSFWWKFFSPHTVFVCE
jgi:2-polyprenyl-3-methyl-5-hydroxy-6-metoxy-1,4-benzoquinol methylase